MTARNAIDTSSISFTALYTGHVWNANGLSAPFFRTRRGSFFYHALAPFEYVGRKVVGGNIRTFLLQRHHLIDHLVRNAIENEGVTQVLEIACGLSPRGYRFTRQYPGLRYVEADLPEMAERKRRLLENADSLSGNHQVTTCNILALDAEDSLENVLARYFNPNEPLLVITEGLVNYFSLETISGFWTRLRNELARFPEGIYLTDNYPLLDDHPFYRTMRALGGMLGSISRSNVSFHFGSDHEAVEYFQGLGFNYAVSHNPRKYYGELDIPRSRGNSFVRIVEGRVKRKLS